MKSYSRKVNDKINLVSQTPSCDILINNQTISLSSTGNVVALHIKYSGQSSFRNASGPGVILKAEKKQVILVGLGRSLQGDILHISGDIVIKNIDVVGSDNKLVQDVNISYNKSTWNTLESKYDTSSQVFKNKKVTSPGKFEYLDPVSSNKKNVGDASIVFKNNLDANLVKLYLDGKRYVGKFHVDIDSGICYSGSSHTKTSVPLSLTDTSKVKGVTEKLTETYEKLKPAYRLKGFLKHIEDIKDTQASTNSNQKAKGITKDASGSTGLTGVPGSASSATSYTGGD